MAVLRLGDLEWRVDPNSIDWTFQLDTAVINTLGGQVVQLLGSTLSDLTISGDFGEDYRANIVSWRLAAAFHLKIKQLMDRQTLPAKTVTQSKSASAVKKAARTGILSDAGVIHDPLPLTYHDGVHNWSFKVLIKSLQDGDGNGSLTMTNGKFAYKYTLTLFIVQADSEIVRKIASDYFLSRISNGLGWKQTKFNGPLSVNDAQDFIVANGGSIASLLEKVITGDTLQDTPTTTTKASPPSTPGQSGTRRGDGSQGGPR